MKPGKQNFGLEAAGSLVPELEGAVRSASHSPRLRPAPAQDRPTGDNTAHRSDQH